MSDLVYVEHNRRIERLRRCLPAGGQLSLAGAGEAQVPGWHARLILFLSAFIRLLSERGKSSC